jgi:hypothetical protein
MQRQFRLLALIVLAYLPAAFSLAQTPAVTVLAAEFGLVKVTVEGSPPRTFRFEAQ